MLIRLFLLALVFCPLALGPAPAAGQTPPGERPSSRPRWLVGCAYDHAPYEFDEDGQPAGFDIDLIRAVAEVMDVNLEIRVGSWPELLEDLKSERLDLLPGVTDTPDRAEYLDFSVPHTRISPGLFVRKGSAIRSLADLQGKQLIVQDHSGVRDLLQQKHGLDVQLVPIVGTGEALRQLASGKHDALMQASKLIALYQINQLGLSNLKAIPCDLPSQDYGFAVRKGNAALLSQLNEGLKILQATGKYQEIYQKWFAVYEPSLLANSRSILITLLIVAAILAVSLLWSWTLRRQVQLRTAELRASEERFRELVEQAPEAIVVYDVEAGRLIEANKNALHLFGCDRSELLRHGPCAFYAPDQPDGRPIPESFQEHNEQALAGGEVLCERIVQPAQGGPVHCEVRVVRFPSENRQLVRASFIDITQRKRVEAELARHREHLEELVQERTAALAAANGDLACRSTQLRALAHQLIEAEQRERRRMAYVLHENFQQLLAAAKFNVQRFRTNSSPEVAQHALELLDEAIAVSRSLTVELCPPVLSELGLGPALEWLVRQAYDKFNLTVQLQLADQTSSCCDDLGTFLFTAARELLLNVAKHARVDTAELHVSQVENQLQLQVVDHGVGFDPTLPRNTSFGLFSIRERVEYLGGRMEIDSAPTQGTRIRLTVPLQVAHEVPGPHREHFSEPCSVPKGSPDSSALRVPQAQEAPIAGAKPLATPPPG